MSLTRRGRVLTILFVIVLLLCIPAVAGYFYLRSIGVYGNSSPGPKVVVVIPKGSSAGKVGEILEGKNVVRSAMGFRIRAYLDGGFEDIQAGRYEMAQGLTAKDALHTLIAQGPLAEDFAVVTFPEGSWLTDFAATIGKDTDLKEKRFLKLVTKGGVTSPLLPEGTLSLEGLLFPSTYQIGDKEDERDVAEKLLTEMKDRMDSVGFSDVEDLGVSEYEGLTIASMVEAEARLDEDRAKIARVIYNRLDAGIALGIDATISYALGEHKTELTVSDLAVDSPYNTRLVKGLPPTPIGAPGAESLDATAHPADGKWLYYVVSDCEGHHAFSETYEEFLANKEVYQGLDCS